MNNYIIKGTFLDTPVLGSLRVRTGYLVIKDKIIDDFHLDIPNLDFEIFDYSSYLIIPGMTDLHLHAPQYSYSGIAMDEQLITWLDKYTYPEEGKFKDLEYANKLYDYFVQDLSNTTTTRACIFATIHTDATLCLMEKLDKEGLITYVGKLAMNRNCPSFYREETFDGINETIRWIKNSNFKNSHPMITPRFTPSVTSDYMEKLGEIALKYNIPMQSHLDENKEEIEWVKELEPTSLHYADTYDKYNLFGKNVKTVMAHCIYCNEEENKLIKNNGVFIAHCPTSNENVIAGIAPAAYYLRNNYNIGLGSDVAGGHTLNLFEVMATAVQVSKIRYLITDNKFSPLTMNEAFYMATIGGGKFFGKVGLFEKGYEFDSVIINDNLNNNPRNFTYEERLEKLAYSRNFEIKAKYVSGNKVK